MNKNSPSWMGFLFEALYLCYQCIIYFCKVSKLPRFIFWEILHLNLTYLFLIFFSNESEA